MTDTERMDRIIDAMNNCELIAYFKSARVELRLTEVATEGHWYTRVERRRELEHGGWSGWEHVRYSEMSIESMLHLLCSVGYIRTL